jgi:hypothetical protein
MMRNNLPNTASLFISRNNRQGLRDPLFLSFLIVIVGLMICCSPAAAHFGFMNFDTGRGTVSAIDVSNQTLLIEDPHIYDYYYEHSEGTFSRLWHWVPMNLSEPGPCTYYSNNLSKISVIQPGDTVVVGFCREKEWGGTIARLAGPGTE